MRLFYDFLTIHIIPSTSAAGLKSFKGRIWPSDCSLPTPALTEHDLSLLDLVWLTRRSRNVICRVYFPDESEDYDEGSGIFYLLHNHRNLLLRPRGGAPPTRSCVTAVRDTCCSDLFLPEPRLRAVENGNRCGTHTRNTSRSQSLRHSWLKLALLAGHEVLVEVHI